MSLKLDTDILVYPDEPAGHLLTFNEPWRGYDAPQFASEERKRLDGVLGPGFYNAFKYASIGMVVVDLEGRCLAANKALCRIMQRGEHELLGEGFQALTHPDDIEKNLYLGQQLISGQISSFQLEKRYLLKSGQFIWVLLSASLMRDANGKPVCVISQLQDIDHIKQTEAALRESEERYRGVVEDLTEAVCRFTPDLTLTFVNDAYCRYYGKTREDMIGRSMLEQAPPELHADVTAYFKALAHAPATVRNRRPAITAGGATRWQEWTNRALFDARGNVSAFQAVGRDVTERMLAEIAEREQRDLAEALRDSAAALNSTLNFEQVLDCILANAARVVPHDYSNVMLVDRATDEVYIVRQRGYTERGLDEWIKTLRLPISLFTDYQLMMRTGIPQVNPDVDKSPTWNRVEKTGWVRSCASAPITIKGQTIGFVNFDSATPGFFNEAHINRLKVFADQIAVAIENARLFESSRQKAIHLTRLHEAGLALAAADTIGKLYQTVVTRASALANTRMSVLTLYDHPNHIVVVDAYGFDPEVIGQRFAFSEGLSGTVAQTREPRQTQRYTDFSGSVPYYRELGVTSAAVFPLIWQDRLIGTIGVCDPGQVVFNEDDMNMLGLYSSLAAAAIDQRRAMQELEAREVDALGEKHRVARAREEERLSIAEQLHDAIGFKLVELQKTAEMAHADIHPDHPNFKRLQDVMALLSTTQDLAQSLSGDLTSNALAELGLSAAIRQYLDRLKDMTGANIHMHVVGRVKRLPDNVERIAYRGVQEAVINALRHAQADRISIRMHYGAGMLRLNITDNGRGFSNETSRGGANTSTRSSSLGLPALQQQVEALNGVFHLRSVIGQGTSLEIELPFQPRAPQRLDVKTRVVLADRQEITRQGFHMLLTQSGDFTCVGEADDGLKAVHQVELHRPDVVVMDMDLPNLNGAEAAYQISKRFPAVHVMILASEGTEAQLQRAIKAGVHSYMLKSDGVETIINGLHRLRDGETSISEALIDLWQQLTTNQHASDPQDLLTLREREVYQLVIAGNTNRVIGERLGISYRTVEVHRKRIMMKFHVRNLAQLMQLADR